MAKERILIVDDEKNIVTSLQEILADEGYEISHANDGISALEMVQADPPALILLDIWIPGMDGIEVLKTVKTYHPEIEVLVMSGHGTIDTAVKATKLGAYDFIEKPFSLDELVQSVACALKLQQNTANTPLAEPAHKRELPHCFQVMVEVKKAIKEAAKSNQPTLIVGENGTGKEFIALAVHQQSKKSNLPMVKLNCSLRTQSSLQSELFVSEKRGKGKNSKAPKPGGQRVVYLKNIEGLSKTLQEKLGQTLKGNATRKKGAASNFLPDQVYASTTQDLESLVEKGEFDQGLFSVLTETRINVPPLRENKAIIPNLVEKYFEEQVESGNSVSRKVSDDALTALQNYDWPENLKELRSILDQISRKVSPDNEIRFIDLPVSIRRTDKNLEETLFDDFDSLRDAEKSWEREFIIHHLRKNKWDLTKSSQALKTDVKRFKAKLEEHNIQMPKNLGRNGECDHPLQRTLKRSVVLCGRGLHSGIKTGLIMQPLPPGSGIIFGDISSGATIPARLDNVQSTDYATILKKGFNSVSTVEHILAVLHMYRISNLLIKINDEAPVMDGSAKDFCQLVEDGEFEEQDELREEIVIDKTYRFGGEDDQSPHITIEPYDGFKVSYHIDYPAPIGIMDYTYEFDGPESFKTDIAPARTFGFVEEIAMLTKMGFGAGGKLDNFILLGDDKVLNTELRYEDEFARHKILDILGDFYLLGKPIRGHIKAHKSGHTQNIGLLKQIHTSLMATAAH